MSTMMATTIAITIHARRRTLYAFSSPGPGPVSGV
jgi:hypothetical protein